MAEDKELIPEKEKLFEQLAAAFGDRKAKKLVKEIERIKAKNPHIKYDFVFSEDGKLTARKKSPLLLEEN